MHRSLRPVGEETQTRLRAHKNPTVNGVEDLRPHSLAPGSLTGCRLPAPDWTHTCYWAYWNVMKKYRRFRKTSTKKGRHRAVENVRNHFRKKNENTDSVRVLPRVFGGWPRRGVRIGRGWSGGRVVRPQDGDPGGGWASGDSTKVGGRNLYLTERGRSGAKGGDISSMGGTKGPGLSLTVSTSSSLFRRPVGTSGPWISGGVDGVPSLTTRVKSSHVTHGTGPWSPNPR